ncbi:FAD binding domain-containing protein [Colletotrichum tofieldiae]|uniref:FAD binding domain-containing protein n=1 Tax=Colletotrichum tofieldiae TaxID=708197 RepID=A0A166WEZ0_9PEZI|nr:FAD binding domain-containing protein [Colletotrichum tofieldiae]
MFDSTASHVLRAEKRKHTDWSVLRQTLAEHGGLIIIVGAAPGGRPPAQDTIPVTIIEQTSDIIRRSLFGISFPGMTWDELIAATNYVAAKATKDGVWRVTYDDTISLTNEEAIGRQPERFKTLRPEHHPKPNEYKLISISPYKVHQRLTESMVAGRILLAAGAAHLCNPFGGLGHTGGIVDVDGLFECSSGINHGKENEKTLHGVYGKASINFDEVLASDEFLKRYEEAESDQENLKELTKVYSQDAQTLSYDFTKHYNPEMAWTLVSGGLSWHRQDSATNAERSKGGPGQMIRVMNCRYVEFLGAYQRYSFGTPDDKFSSEHRRVATSSGRKEKSDRKNVGTRASEWPGCLLYDSSQLCPSQGTRDNKRVS